MVFARPVTTSSGANGLMRGPTVYYLLPCTEISLFLHCTSFCPFHIIYGIHIFSSFFVLCCLSFDRLSTPKFQWVAHLRCNIDLSKQCRANFHLYLVLHSHKDRMAIHRRQFIPWDSPHLLFISSEPPLLP